MTEPGPSIAPLCRQAYPPPHLRSAMPPPQQNNNGHTPSSRVLSSGNHFFEGPQGPGPGPEGGGGTTGRPMSMCTGGGGGLPSQGLYKRAV